MPNITLSVPDEVHKIIKKHREIESILQSQNKEGSHFNVKVKDK